MSTSKKQVSLQGQFQAKQVSRRAAAAAPFEEKVARLIELQKINYELARNSGRMAKRPCPINVVEKVEN
jgi:hypothetical protein